MSLSLRPTNGGKVRVAAEVPEAFKNPKRRATLEQQYDPDNLFRHAESVLGQGDAMQRVSAQGYHFRQLAAAAAMAVVMVTGTGVLHAQSPRSAAAAPSTAASLTIAELERAFWICDWTATTSVLDVDMYTACAATASELKARRFAGDFERMIGWWREHKAAAHAGLQARRLAAAPRP